MPTLEQVVLNTTTITKDTQIVAGTLLIPEGAEITVENAKLEIRCETLVVEGDVFFNGRGTDGRDGQSPDPLERMPGWISGLHHEDHDRRHTEWEQAWFTQAPHEEGEPAKPGTDGQNGAHISILYRRLGEGSQLGRIRHDVGGGRGGRPAQGGLGRLLICGSPSHSAREQVRRNGGAPYLGGANGKPGSWSLERIPD